MTNGRRVGEPTHWVNRWFETPEPNAAGRMGIFRCLYGLFYLWHISIFDLTILAGMPADYRKIPILLFDWLPNFASPISLQALDSLLVAALVLLVCGQWTRAATLVVLVAGVVREALHSGVNLENSNVFLVFYIPLLMAIAGRWGDTYSLDAVHGERRGAQIVAPSENAWPHFLAARGVLIILVVLFLSSPVFKSFGGGTWLSEPNLLSNLMLERSIRSAALGYPANPLAPWIAAHPPAGFVLQLCVLVFEGLFFLALFGRNLRSFFVAMAMVFHSINAFFLGVSFTPILIVYGLFVDWEGLARRLPSHELPRPQISSWTATSAVVFAAALLSVSWQSGAARLFNLGGLLDWHSMLIPVFPVALGWAAISALRILRSGSSLLKLLRDTGG